MSPRCSAAVMRRWERSVANRRRSQIAVAVMPVETESAIEGQGRFVAGAHLQITAGGAAGDGPVCQRGQNPGAVSPPPPRRRDLDGGPPEPAVVDDPPGDADDLARHVTQGP